MKQFWENSKFFVATQVEKVNPGRIFIFHFLATRSDISDLIFMQIYNF